MVNGSAHHQIARIPAAVINGSAAQLLAVPTAGNQDRSLVHFMVAFVVEGFAPVRNPQHPAVVSSAVIAAMALSTADLLTKATLEAKSSTMAAGLVQATAVVRVAMPVAAASERLEWPERFRRPTG